MRIRRLAGGKKNRKKETALLYVFGNVGPADAADYESFCVVTRGELKKDGMGREE